MRNCFADPFSTSMNPPWNLSACVCSAGFTFNNDYSKCIRTTCSNVANSNGSFVYSNCLSQPANVLANKNLYFPANVYPINLTTNSNLTVQLSWPSTSTTNFTIHVYSTVQNYFTNTSPLGSVSVTSANSSTLTYISTSNAQFYIGINSSSTTLVE